MNVIYLYDLVENIADNQNKFYVVPQTNEYKPFEALAFSSTVTESYCVADRKDASFSVLKLNLSGVSVLKIQSNYIFLPNPYKKQTPSQHKDTDNVIVIEIGKNVYSFISNTFPNLSRVESTQDTLFHRKYRCSLPDTVDEHAIFLIINEVAEITYLDVIVEGRSKSQAINCLEKFQSLLLASGVRDEYVDIISYDAISEFYCNKILPKINTLERNLRKLLFNIYIVNFGKEYYSATINLDLQKKIKGVIQAKGSRESKELEILRQFFYSFEFGDIQQLLFSPSWTTVETRKRETFLSENPDLSVFSDQQLREAFSNFTPKSDWERFFSDKIDVSEIEQVIEEIRKYRNSAAHFKSFSKKDYSDCSLLIQKLNRAVLNAIRITEEKDFSDKNLAYLKQSLSGISKRIDEFKQTLTDSIAKNFLSQLQAEFSSPCGFDKLRDTITGSLCKLGSSLLDCGSICVDADDCEE